MMKIICAILLSVLASTLATHGHGGHHDHGGHYSFGYKVHDGYNNFGHSESRHGGHTKGQYHVKLPNGKLQTVTYHVVGYSGYVAKVHYGHH
eukprot:TCALIF_09777-PA protein Name:"Protein of unknown function" AED:0.26 eAED:0.26 QI:48/1/0.5/1/0/0.5/2/0/91